MNNLITIDIGNSNVDLGLFKNEDLVYNAKISTQDNKSEFEIATSIKPVSYTHLTLPTIYSV